MIKNISKIFIFLICFVNLAFAQIYVSLPDTSIETQSRITIPIYISNVGGKGIYSYQFHLKYDKEILKPKSIIDDETISDKRTWKIDAYLDDEGLVVDARGWYWLSDGGVLLYIKFDILTDVGSTDLILDSFKFNYGNPKPIISNGAFEVYVKKTINFQSAGTGGGKVSINGEKYNLPFEVNLKKGKSYTFKALPDGQSNFNKWDGDINSAKNPITYKVLNNADIIVNFSKRSYTVSASLEPQDFGYVEGVGVYNYGETALLKANPYSGKKFLNWQLDGNIVGNNLEYEIEVVDDVNLVAHFENALVQITASANPLEGGLVTGSGYYYPNDMVTIKANSNSNWIFSNWTENNEIVSDDSIFSFIVIEDRELMANYTLVTDIEFESNNSINKSFLSLPYPNPFNPSTTFNFALNTTSKVTLFILDITGKVVSNIYNNENLSRGHYQNVFNASSLSSGVYFFRFEAYEIETKKIILKSGKIVLVK